MEKIFKYKPNEAISFTLHTKQRVAIQNESGNDAVLDIKMPASAPIAKVFGNWVIEFWGNTVTMRETTFFEPITDCISFSFQEQKIDMEISGAGLQENLKNAESLSVYPSSEGKIKVILKKSEAPQPGHQTPEEGKKEIEALKKELSETKKEIIKLHEIIEKNLLSEISAQNEIFDSLKKNEQNIIEQLSDIQAHTDELNKSISEKQTQLQAKEQEKARLYEELSNLEKKEEFLTLDCDTASEQIKEMDTRVHLDSDTLTLLEDDSILKQGSVSKTLTKMEKEIEAVEKRIALILNFRAKFNNTVENAILSGDGTISNSEESGGASNGDREGTPSENTTAAESN